MLTPEPGKGLPDTGLGLAFPNPLDPPPGCAFHPRCRHAQDVCKRRAPALVPDGDARTACHAYASDTKELFA